MKQEVRKAFTEVNEIIKLMPIELINKIPIEFRYLIKEECDKKYLPNIKEPIEQCKLKDETIIILGIIYREFFSLPEEREKLKEKDSEELQKMQQFIEKELREKYNPENIFNKEERKNLNEDKKENDSIILVVKEKWYKRIVNLIKKIFKRKK